MAFLKRPIDLGNRSAHGINAHADALRLLPGRAVLRQGGIRRLFELGDEHGMLVQWNARLAAGPPLRTEIAGGAVLLHKAVDRRPPDSK